MTDAQVVLLAHLQNEIVKPGGVIGARGNAAAVERNATLTNAAQLLAAARAAGATVVHVGNAYDEAGTGVNRSVPQFAGAVKAGLLRQGYWGAEFAAEIEPGAAEAVILRTGIGAFTGTALADMLPTPAGTTVFVGGVSTRLVVEAIVFELADRGYAPVVVADCCTAATEVEHDDALRVLARFARVASLAESVAQLRDVRAAAHG